MEASVQQLHTKTVSAAEWKKLSAKKVYFGHQSVGYDIIGGIQNLMKSNPAVTLNLQETIDPEKFNAGIFAHSINGENCKPKTKVDAFVKTMGSGVAKKTDIAFFKFCYVDFDENTDINDLFAYYSSSMDGLIKKYPGTTFIHVTAPLTAEGEFINVKYYLKHIIKKILGRADNSLVNIKRNEFNSLLRKKYGPKSILDIELYESTNPDGTRRISHNAGKDHFSLVPEYTHDGGHLSETGRILVADKFLATLARM
ncbi:MAG: hypothetical protein KA369_11645 [Spirochaetes bacterium]|nr:hypothetical protein [Spirochaetota bacterium]